MAAAAALRARGRSDNAALVAVGRLRAPQSVFNPLHRTPSRPEMRRSITHGRFSPVGRKLWRQSEGLCPRTGQLCLSPRRRMLAGGANGVGAGAPIVPYSGGKPTDVFDRDELRPSLATHQEEGRWRLTDTAANTSRVSADSSDGFEGGGESFTDVPQAGDRPREEEEEQQRGEKDAGRDDTKTTEASASGLNRAVGGGDSAPRETGEEVHEAAVSETRGDDGAMPTGNRGGDDGGVPRSVDTGAPGGFFATAMPGDGDARGGWSISTPDGPECPPSSTATRCLSYTVKLPWNGHK